MCGIAGKMSLSMNGDTREAVSKMCSTMVHRGPDDSGIIQLGKITLGHRRLSIIDLSKNGHQPMSTSDNRYHIVFNGEVYNFMQIRMDLISAGVQFSSHTDTEVVLKSYAFYGVKCLSLLDGMFAFAIWDSDEHKLILARDRFGKKPLFYCLKEGKFICFASELRALQKDRAVSEEISIEAINCYLALGYILNPLTMLKDANQLEPGTYMVVSEECKVVERKRYWDYAEAFRRKTNDNDETIKEKIVSLLSEAVRKRMISDVPVGAFLSGGVDSSSVVAMMKRFHNGELHTFSAGFNATSYDESADAAKVADYLSTIHHNVLCEPGIENENIDFAINAFSQVFSDNSLIPMVAVSQLASKYVKVVLSGDGADEMFAGYPTYKADKMQSVCKLIPKMLIKLMQEGSAGGNIFKRKKLDFNFKMRQFAYGAQYGAEKAHYSWRLIFRPEERVEILGKKYRDLVYDTDPVKRFEMYYKQVKDLDNLDRHLFVDAMTWLPDDILVKVDRSTMYASIEARCPYLDIDLASYVASIPRTKKMPLLKTKHILKKALKNQLPDFVLNKKKSGFNSPIGSWLNRTSKNEFQMFTQYVLEKKWS